MNLSRRDFMSAAAGAACWLSGATISRGSTIDPPRRRRLGYGAAVALADLRADPRLGAAVAEYCTGIVPVYELKWGTLRPTRDAFAFEKGDALFDFARVNDLTMRGHNLVWYYGLPDWTREIASAAEAERELVNHIETVVSHYRGRLTSWDVVNEPIPDNVENPTDRRECLWSKFLGPRYIPLAFRTAAAADPAARLTLNEYDVEFADGRFPIKRAALRRLALELLDSGAPLHAIGLQCHLRGAKAIDRDGLSGFVEEMRAEGLDVYVTELDVMDQDLPGPIKQRDAIIASRVQDVLDAISAPEPIGTLLTWGLSDRYSWISQVFPRADHMPNRPLPLDAEFQPKPFMAALAKYTHAAA